MLNFTASYVDRPPGVTVRASGRMAEHLDTGREGERLACRFLEELGLEVLHRNWRHARDEVDLIARTAREIVFVEVKTRRSDRSGQPFEAVGLAKRRKLLRAAEAYLAQHPSELDVRFDVVSIVLGPRGPRIEHLPEAFFNTPDGPQ